MQKNHNNKYVSSPGSSANTPVLCGGISGDPGAVDSDQCFSYNPGKFKTVALRNIFVSKI